MRLDTRARPIVRSNRRNQNAREESARDRNSSNTEPETREGRESQMSPEANQQVSPQTSTENPLQQTSKPILKTY